MRLTTRLASAIVGMVVLILAIAGWSTIKRERALFVQDAVSDHEAMGEILRQVLARVAQHGGQEMLDRILREAEFGASQVQMVWVWLEKKEPTAARTDLLSTAGLERLRTGANVVELREDTLPATITTGLAVVRTNDRTGALVVRESLAADEAHVKAGLRGLVIVLVIILLVSVPTAGALGAWLVGRPVEELVRTVRRIGEGDLQARATRRFGHELDTIAVEIGRMCDHLIASRDAQQRAHELLWHADRLATVGTLATGIAHEVGTPLNVVSGYARLLAGQASLDVGAREAAAHIVEQTERITRLIRDLTTFARRGEARRVPVDLRSLVESMIRMLEPIARKAAVELVTVGGEGAVTASVDPGQIQQVLTNLVVNAIHASKAAGVVRVGVALAAVGECQLWVEDAGSGIARTLLPRIFEPFFTTKGAGEGTGLGLAIVHGIVEGHGGRVEVDSREGSGTTFRVYLKIEESV